MQPLFGQRQATERAVRLLQRNQMRRPLTGNSRGAAFLLAVYLASLMLFALGGIGIMRSTTELQAAKLSVDSNRAFALAEAGVDDGLAHLEGTQTLESQEDAILEEMGPEYSLFNTAETLKDGTYGPYTTSSGYTYMLHIKTISIEVKSPDAMQVTREITSSGTMANGVNTNLKATVTSQDMPLAGGIFSNGSIRLGATFANGSLHSASGEPGSIWLGNYVTDPSIRIYGDVTIGRPDPANPYTKLYGAAKFDGSRYVADGAGIVVNGYRQPGKKHWIEDANGNPIKVDWSPQEAASGGFKTVYMPPIQGIGLSKFTGVSSRILNTHAHPLALEEGEIVEIHDGGPEDLDQEEGAITLKATNLFLDNKAQLVFDAPTKIYLTGKDEEAEYDIVRLDPLSVLLAVNSDDEILDSNDQTIRSGVALLVTDRHTSSRVIMDQPWAFFGSIWAPESTVNIKPHFQWYTEYSDYQKQILNGVMTLEEVDDIVRRSDTYVMEVPGGLHGIEFGYVVSNNYTSGGGCSAIMVDQARSKRATSGPYKLSSWRNSKEDVSAASSDQMQGGPDIIGY